MKYVWGLGWGQLSLCDLTMYLFTDDHQYTLNHYGVVRPSFILGVRQAHRPVAPVPHSINGELGRGTDVTLKKIQVYFDIKQENFKNLL